MKPFPSRLFLCVAFSFFLCSFSTASHIAGGNITYECLGNDQYRVIMELFRDCGGNVDAGNIKEIAISSDCGMNKTTTLELRDSSEITQLCPGRIGDSECNGGGLPGFQGFTYTGVVSLPEDCDAYRFRWNKCCRNESRNIDQSQQKNLFIESTLNTANADCNNSPVFYGQPVPFVCGGQFIHYSLESFEADGDSLAFSLVPAWGKNGVKLPYQPGYTGNEPIPGITVDSGKGDLKFQAPDSIGVYIVTLRVKEYNANGKRIGTVRRDLQFVVLGCSDPPPFSPDSGNGAIDSLKGGAQKTDDHALKMCAGESFCFDVAIESPEPGDSIRLRSNVSSVLPGASFKWTNGNPARATICWNDTGGVSGERSFRIVADNQECPVNGRTTFTYDLKIKPRTLALSDHPIICGDQAAQLEAKGGSTFDWTVIAGDPMDIGNNFSCDSCSDPVASPDSTTSYELTGTLSSGCVNRDTITVEVVPDFNVELNVSDTTPCVEEPVFFETTTDPPDSGGYSYSWEPSDFLEPKKGPAPTARFLFPGNYPYMLEVKSPKGCVKRDSVFLSVDHYRPVAAPSASDTVLCRADSTLLKAGIESNVPGIDSGDRVVEWKPHNGLADPGAPNTFASPDSSTTYHLRVRDTTTGCTYRDSLDIQVTKGFSLQVGPDNFNTCGPASVALVAEPEPNDTGQYDYEWTPSIPLDNPSTRIPVARDLEGGDHTFTVEVTGEKGCQRTDSVKVRIDPRPQAGPLALDTGLCLGDTTTLVANLDTTIPGISVDQLAFEWSPASQVLQPNEKRTKAVPEEATTYTLRLSDTATGCSYRDSVTVDVAPLPDLAFMPDPSSGTAPLKVVFENRSGANVDAFWWDLGDGSAGPSDGDTVHTYKARGTFRVVLRGKNEYGCVDSTVRHIDVGVEPLVEVPNVFTPNEDPDRKNERFDFRELKKVERFRGRIFDRYGNKVHEWSKRENAWGGDGHAAGTYFYVIHVWDLDGDEHAIKGTVTLLR